MGAIGKSVAQALIKGIDGLTFEAYSDLNKHEYTQANLSFEDLAKTCDLIIECLPPHVAPEIAKHAIKAEKTLIIISSSALLLYPEILELQKQSTSRIIVPSGALIGLDGVNALKNIGISSAKIASTKPPIGFSTAPFVEKNNIDLQAINEKTLLFSGNAFEAAKAFPANVNVAATLSLASIGPEKVHVEVWADPEIKGNRHDIKVTSEFSEMQASVQNMPDPNNPKTSVLAAQSIIGILRNMHEPFVVL